jgi:NAD+ kinase
MKVALFGKAVNEGEIPPISKIIHKMEDMGWEITVHEDLYRKLKPAGVFRTMVKIFSSTFDYPGDSDFFLSIGGDGTLLNSIPFIRNREIPIIGLNTGRLGFLASINLDETEQAIEQIQKREYSIEKRSLLSLETAEGLFGDLNFALNEFVVSKSDSASMITIHAFLNGDFLNSYWADGLIISTPTGSTAYSLSCGGPIAMPDSENFIITPVSPHNLNVRPIIISDKDVITIRAEGRTNQHMVSLDSRTSIIDSLVEMTIKKADFGVNLIRLRHHSFGQTLRNKLHWGVDRRNAP